MPRFEVAVNEGSTLYEVHAAGCRHTTMNPRLTVMTTKEAATGKEAAALYESQNEGCRTKLGPCARKGA